MAWGFFCWIPCPYKKWNEDDRPAMLAMLPLVGTFIGVITGFVWWAMMLLDSGQFLTGAVVAAVYFLLTGFIHLDGYMDCCDAVLPRHPDMERRQEILKDSHTGAFGAIGLAVMLMLFVASVADITEGEYLLPVVLMSIVATASRTVSVVNVLNRSPMGTSQYNGMSSERSAKIYTVISIIICAVVFVTGYWILKMTTEVVIVVIVTVIASECTGVYDRRALGGMNGDISGHMIVTGEMFGLLAAALMM